jgi:diguanylate cyclase (GGDEF)-like protein
VVGELFSQFDNNLHGLIIDDSGKVYIDSDMQSDKEYLMSNNEATIEELFSDPALLYAVKTNFEGNATEPGSIAEPTIQKLTAGLFNYVAVAPVQYTNWSVVLLYEPTPSLGLSLFLPVAFIVIALMVTIAIATNATSRRLFFKPLAKLIYSIARLREDQAVQVYGVERDDEFGEFSNTIQDLFTKANYDALTGIYNRRFLENNLTRIIKFLSRSNGQLSILMLDVDFFKRYNDTYGHDKGDACLRAVAQALDGSITRDGDFVARYGGEEFIAVLPNTNEAGARIAAEKVIENIRGLKIPHEKSEAAEYVTVSIGVASSRVVFTQSWEEYIKAADEALYLSKQNGRNQYTCSEVAQ